MFSGNRESKILLLGSVLSLSVLFFALKMTESTESPALTYDEAKALTTAKDSATEGFFFQQTMYRIKDPKASLKFYNEVLGMSLLAKVDFPKMKFSLYFMGYENPDEIPTGDIDEVMKWTCSKKATLELTHNWGTENKPDFSYHNGNAEPRGFGHIGIVVPNVEEACKRFEKYNVEFIKKPNDGSMKGIAFIKDPDGYWIEILSGNASMKDYGAQ